jgi:LmbE family N-acetylglucosaminyl deacetylase
MLSLFLPRPLRLLCLGAHCDDIEIGCGGTILRLLHAMPEAEIRWVVMTGSAERRDEAAAAADAFLAGASSREIELHDFRESFLPQHWGAVKDEIERLKADFQPSVILTHRCDDAHQDHRLLGELAWNTFRDHLILEYEIPKYDGDVGRPNLFVPLTDEIATRKVALLQTHFASQRRRAWFDDRTFFALMRLRGMECNAPDGWAEGFTARKVVVNSS